MTIAEPETYAYLKVSKEINKLTAKARWVNTMICRPCQLAVVTAWRVDCGLPGWTIRMRAE